MSWLSQCRLNGTPDLLFEFSVFSVSNGEVTLGEIKLIILKVTHYTLLGGYLPNERPQSQRIASRTGDDNSLLPTAATLIFALHQFQLHQADTSKSPSPYLKRGY